MITEMSERAPVSFDRLNNLFFELQSDESLSELHGLLCGQCCAGLRPGHNAWLAMAIEHMAIDESLASDTKSMLFQLYDDTLTQLQSEEYSFQLLLPDDEEALEQRTQATGQWCQGFLSGYGLSGLTEEDLSEEASSVLKDFSSIAQVAFDGMDESEKAEKDFFEVGEYLRMATLMLFGEQNEAVGATGMSMASVH